MPGLETGIGTVDFVFLDSFHLTKVYLFLAAILLGVKKTAIDIIVSDTADELR